jgi:hypothetical protein
VGWLWHQLAWPGWGSVYPNLIASLIWATPAFVTSHVLHRRHVDRRHRELLNRIDRTHDQ